MKKSRAVEELASQLDIDYRLAAQVLSFVEYQLGMLPPKTIDPVLFRDTYTWDKE